MSWPKPYKGYKDCRISAVFFYKKNKTNFTVRLIKILPKTMKYNVRNIVPTIVLANDHKSLSKYMEKYLQIRMPDLLINLFAEI